MIVVPRCWPNSTIVCLATGPSLTAVDVAFVRDKARVIAVNDAYRLAPWADVLYACDAEWWRWHNGAKEFPGVKYSMVSGSQTWTPKVKKLTADVLRVRETGDRGLDRDPSGLRHGKNSGYQAINLAVHLGASRIVLLGYDMKLAMDGRPHFFGQHPNRRRPVFKDCLPLFATLVQPLRDLGISIVNCTRDTALTCFERGRLEDVLAGSEVAA